MMIRFVLVLVSISFCAGAYTDDKKWKLQLSPELTQVSVDNSSLILASANANMTDEERLQGVLALFQDAGKLMKWGIGSAKGKNKPAGAEDHTLDWGPKIIKGAGKMCGVTIGDTTAKVMFAGLDAVATTVLVSLFPPAGAVIAVHTIAAAMNKVAWGLPPLNKGKKFNAKNLAIDVTMGVAGVALAIVTGIDSELADFKDLGNAFADASAAGKNIRALWHADLAIGIAQNFAGDGTGVISDVFTADGTRKSVNTDGSFVDTSKKDNCRSCLAQNAFMFPGGQPTDATRLKTKVNWCHGDTKVTKPADCCIATGPRGPKCPDGSMIWIRKMCP